MYRFYDPKQGRILINNQDIKNVSLESLQKSIGIVPQDTVLFNDTILYNIHYGNFSANIDQVYDACRVSDLHETIMKFPVIIYVFIVFYFIIKNILYISK